MNFNKKIKFKNFLINIKIKQNFFCINNRYYFGYPIGEKKVFANKDLNYQCRNLFGYFFIIEIKKDSIDFYTDVIGNYRVYYYYEKDFILITDDLNEIYKKKKKNFFKIDENTFNFFKLKNYTPGNTTFLNGIFKFQPASNYSIKNSNKFIIKNYYLNYKNTPNFRELKDKINRNFINQFKYLKNKKVVLFFSGGKDSLFIFYYLLKMKINFECVFYDTQIKSVISDSIKFVKITCKQNKIKLRIIKIPLIIEPDFNKFLFSEMLFDYHYSLLHFSTFKKLKNIYNRNTIFVSGQSCDSILSFGPSAYTVSNFIARYINLYPSNLFSSIFSKILNLKFKNKIFTSKNLKDFCVNFYNSFFYYSIECEKNTKLKDYSFNILNKLKINKYEPISKKMYLKCHGFLQGPDNQVFIKTANHFNFDKIILPFANYNFIKIVNEHYNFKIDLIFPKYIIDYILVKNFNINLLVLIKNIFINKKKKYQINLNLVNSNFKKKIIKKIEKLYG